MREKVINLVSNIDYKLSTFNFQLSILLCAFILITSIPAGAKDIHADKTTIKLKDEVVVEGNTICLGDIAEIRGEKKLNWAANPTPTLAKIEIGKSALPGYYRVIDLNYIKLKIKQKRVPLNKISWEGAKKVKVKTSYQEIPLSQLQELAEKYIKENIPSTSSVEIKFSSLPKNLIIPSFPYEIKVNPENKILRFKGYLNLPIEIYIGGKIYRRLNLALNIRLQEMVAVAKKTINCGEKIEETNISWEKKDTSYLPADVVTSIDMLKGKIAKRTIISGSVIRENMIDIPTLVFPNKEVKVLVKVGNVRAETIGIAKEKGKKDEIIKVINKRTKKEIWAKVIDENLVEVFLDSSP